MNEKEFEAFIRQSPFPATKDKIPGGYAGKILLVDLSAGRTEDVNLPPENILRKWLGGQGLGQYILMHMLPVGTKPLSLDNFQACVMCHDNSRGGSRRLDKYLHLIHTHRDNFPVPKNNCAVCHLTASSIRKVSLEACSHCHENLHENNRPGYPDSQCQSCHADYGEGHIVAGVNPG